MALGWPSLSGVEHFLMSRGESTQAGGSEGCCLPWETQQNRSEQRLSEFLKSRTSYTWPPHWVTVGPYYCDWRVPRMRRMWTETHGETPDTGLLSCLPLRWAAQGFTASAVSLGSHQACRASPENRDQGEEMGRQRSGASLLARQS